MIALPPDRERALNVFAVLVAVAVVSAVAFIATGRRDPFSMDTELWRSEPNVLYVQPGGSTVVWLNETDLSEVTIVAGARELSGDTDIGYGLLLRQPQETLAIAVSPLGYAAIWRQDSQADPQVLEWLLPWQPWPHVQTGGQGNEIAAQIKSGMLNVRINREALWQSPDPGVFEATGIFATSFEDAAEVTFDGVRFFAN